jgi:hypothetical protein
MNNTKNINRHTETHNILGTRVSITGFRKDNPHTNREYKRLYFKVKTEHDELELPASVKSYRGAKAYVRRSLKMKIHH